MTTYDKRQSRSAKSKSARTHSATSAPKHLARHSEVPEDISDEGIRAYARKLVRAVGPNRAARELGINRITVLSLAADAPALAATFALVRETMRRNHEGA